MATEPTNNDDSTDTENTNDAGRWSVENIRGQLPNSLGTEGTRAAVCAIRNPNATKMQITEKTGVKSPYTVANALRSLLVGATDSREHNTEMYEIRGTQRNARGYSELTEKQTAVIDFAAEHPEYVHESSYGDLSQAIKEKTDIAVSETYVGTVLRKYSDILARRQAHVADTNEDGEDALENVATDLSVREMLEAAGYDLPDENRDEMPETTTTETAGGERSDPPSEDPRTTSSAYLSDAYIDEHTPRPGAEDAARLPDDAQTEDVQPNTPYWAYVNNIEPYGVFVSLTNPAYGDDVSGLVHDDRLYGTPVRYSRGDPMVVELDHESPDGLAFTDWRHAHPDKLDAKKDEDEAAEEAEGDREKPGPPAEGSIPRTVHNAAERPADDRVTELEQAVDTLREDAVLASEISEFADEVETRLETVERSMQNSITRETHEQTDQNTDRIDTLQEAVNALGEQVEQATGHGEALGRVMQDVQRLRGQDATVASYSYQRQDGTVTIHLQVDLGADKQADAEQVPECHECGAPLGDEWRAANEKAQEHGTIPAACPQCGGNPLPPVGGQQEDDA
jgi:hypothetical protein